MWYLILGTTEALDPRGAPVPLGGARLRALLAALALRAGRSVSVGELLADVYGDESPHDANAALQALVGRLRRVLGKDAVASGPGGYRLVAEAEDVDLYVFERHVRDAGDRLDAGDPEAAAALLRTALALFRGPALADLPEHAGVRHEAQRLAAHRRRVEADLRRGATGGLVPELTELTATYPYDETFHAQLIRALRAEGRPADALAAYEAARRTLAEALGADPGPELTALHAELLAGEPPRTPHPQAHPPRPAPPGVPTTSGPSGLPGLSAPSGLSDPSGQSGPLAPSRQPRQSGPSGQSAPSRPSALAGPSGLSDPSGPSDSFAPPTPPTPPAPVAYPASAPRPTPVAHPTAGVHPTPAAHPASGAHPAPAAPPASAAHPAPVAYPAPPVEVGNIRPRLTSFVGREPELVALRADLGRSRLVTLTGPGGSGKTRLAEEAALQAVGPAAWIAELAPLDDPDAVPGAVLSALRLRETNLITRDGVPLRDDPTAHLVEHLARRPLLLVLDNCEHVIGAAAALAETLLTHCPELRILATSREPLGVPGESVRPVEPLPPHPAHRLFAERARTVRPGFRPEDDVAAVDEICRRLDGLPLAIELAAARLRLLTPRQIADRLDDRFLLLTSGSRTVLPRQQTLRAVVDWSWDLLDAAERDLLRQASVFAGGWDLAAAEALAPDEPSAPSAPSNPSSPSAAGTTDTLGSLVEKSLVVATPTDDGEMRYRLLETIHEYAVERAAETPELLAAAEAAHTAHFTALAETAEPLLRSGEQLPWIARIERDLDNIRAALHRTTLTVPDEAAAHRLVFAMGWFWWLRNYRPEGLAWTERSLGLGEDPEDPADPRYWPRMHLRMLQFFLTVESQSRGDFRDDPETVAAVARVRAAFSAAPGPQSARFPGLLWPFTAYFTDEPAEVRGLLDSAVANCRRHGGEWEIGVSLMFRTHMAVDMPGGMPGVDEDLAELRVISRRVGDRWMRAQVASAAAEAAMMRGRHEQAREAYEEALGLAREVGAHAEAPFLLARLAELDFRVGDPAAAVKGLDESSAEAERFHVTDAQIYVSFLRAGIALYEGDAATARAHVEAAGALIDQGPPPPHFQAVVRGLAARIQAQEGAGAVAVTEAAEALRIAQDAQCAEFIVAALGDGLATALALTGEPGLAARVLGAVDSLRGGTPRSVPEQRETDAVTIRARAELGDEGYDTAYAAGRGLTVDEVLTLAEPYKG
ncbi:AfsR/SARP family transcriptional regulator [Streptomyces sp. NPDC085481]|uniref:AfsR/SARP family transcriptional regulator n=1 Tax=Streptomyces sp. NPDC085481 TaxID=3365727 RepID=UPI0037D34969